MSEQVRPAMMKYLEKHNAAFASMSKQSRRVDIEQNHTWRIRMLPVAFGPEKEPFVSIAHHWWNKSPITCPRHTAPAWGGDPDYPCPVCDASDTLNESRDKEKSDIGYKARCNIKVRAWCIVFDTEDQRGNIEDMAMAEILNPYEFDMYKTTWEAFSKYQRVALSRRRTGTDSDWGLLDLETGCDLLATQGGRGVSLDRCDPSPIFPLDDPKYDEYLQKIWSRLHEPKIVIPDERQLLEVADKILDFADNGGRPRRGEENGRGRGGRGRDRDEDTGGRGRGRGRGQDDYEAAGNSRRSSRSRYQEDADPAEIDDGGTTEVAPASRRRSAAPESEQGSNVAPPPTQRSATPPRRSAAPASDDPQPAQPEQENKPKRQAPPERTSAAGAPPARRSVQPVAEAEETPTRAEEQEAGPENPGDAPTPEELDQDQSNATPAPPPPARRTAPTTAPTSAPPPARRTVASGNGGPPARRSAPQPEGGVDAEEDNVPEERHDHAPKTPAQVEETPPTVAVTAPEPRKAAAAPDSKTADIRSRLDKLNAKGR